MADGNRFSEVLKRVLEIETCKNIRCLPQRLCILFFLFSTPSSPHLPLQHLWTCTRLSDVITVLEEEHLQPGWIVLALLIFYKKSNHCQAFDDLYNLIRRQCEKKEVKRIDAKLRKRQITKLKDQLWKGSLTPPWFIEEYRCWQLSCLKRMSKLELDVIREQLLKEIDAYAYGVPFTDMPLCQLIVCAEIQQRKYLTDTLFTSEQQKRVKRQPPVTEYMEIPGQWNADFMSVVYMSGLDMASALKWRSLTTSNTTLRSFRVVNMLLSTSSSSPVCSSIAHKDFTWVHANLPRDTPDEPPVAFDDLEAAILTSCDVFAASCDDLPDVIAAFVHVVYPLDGEWLCPKVICCKLLQELKAPSKMKFVHVIAHQLKHRIERKMCDENNEDMSEASTVNVRMGTTQHAMDNSYCTVFECACESAKSTDIPQQHSTFMQEYQQIFFGIQREVCPREYERNIKTIVLRVPGCNTVEFAK